MKGNCEALVDVGFILDSSGSLRNDYVKQKYFLKTLAAMFGVSSVGSRVGVVTFSYVSELSIKLSDYSNISSFNQAVDNITWMGSTSRIDKALRLAQKELFNLVNGGRDGVPKLLILLTDDSQTQEPGAESPGEIADELRADGINIIVVGIGKGVNKTELVQIAGNPQNVYSAFSYDELTGSDFITSSKEGTCKRGNNVLFFSDQISKGQKQKYRVSVRI